MTEHDLHLIEIGERAGIEAAINALEADAKICDCAALDARGLEIREKGR